MFQDEAKNGNGQKEPTSPPTAAGLKRDQRWLDTFGRLEEYLGREPTDQEVNLWIMQEDMLGEV